MLSYHTYEVNNLIPKKLSKEILNNKFITINISLGINVVDDSPIDYMHVVCLGTMSRLLTHWMKVVPNFKDGCDTYIDQMLAYWPNELPRKGRHLSNISNFKATEFRAWILYYGPYVMRFFLSQQQFEHFLLLHHALRLLFLMPQKEEYLQQSEECLKEFLVKWPTVYPNLALTYVVHSMEHLPEDCRNTGTTPDDFSAFPYESYLRRVKRNYHGGGGQLEQVYNDS